MGKTLVSSSIIDAVVKGFNRQLVEVPVGFKYFAEGLFQGKYCFGGEESAGASFLRRNGKVWTTDKDGMIMGLLAAEVLARTGKEPSAHYQEISQRFGARYYTRVDVPANQPARDKLKAIKPEAISITELGGDPVEQKLSHSPGTNYSIGGLKITTRNGWFAVRPSGTEDKAKIYAESLRSEAHLQKILEEAFGIIQRLEARPAHSG